MNNKGFTLVEVLAVIVIIAILGLIAVPSVLSIINTGRNSSYDIMVGSIKTAASEMYQDIEYFDSKIYNYNNSGKIDDELIEISDDGEIEFNLQTLVNNGYLTGTNNEDVSDACDGTLTNCNKKIIVEPKNNNDIGLCKIKVTKVKGVNSKVCYKIDSNSGGVCPTTEDFGGSNQCIS